MLAQLMVSVLLVCTCRTSLSASELSPAESLAIEILIINQASPTIPLWFGLLPTGLVS